MTNDTKTSEHTVLAIKERLFEITKDDWKDQEAAIAQKDTKAWQTLSIVIGAIALMLAYADTAAWWLQAITLTFAAVALTLGAAVVHPREFWKPFDHDWIPWGQNMAAWIQETKATEPEAILCLYDGILANIDESGSNNEAIINRKARLLKWCMRASYFTIATAAAAIASIALG